MEAPPESQTDSATAAAEAREDLRNRGNISVLLLFLVGYSLQVTGYAPCCSDHCYCCCYCGIVLNMMMVIIIIIIATVFRLL